MALGKRRAKQQELLVPTTGLPRSPGHPFYSKLNELLAGAKFDHHVESLCEPYYKEGGRPSIPPGAYFRMLLVGYFEGVDSQRGIAWRCSDSRSLQDFLGLLPTERTPDHSSLTVIRKRLPVEVHEEVFAFVVKIAKSKGMVKGKTLAVDTTTLEANAAMKSIVRKDTGKGWSDYVRELAKEEGVEDPTEEDLRRFDRKRRGKKVSNKDWESPSDPDSRIAKMKDGRTHLAYKVQHALDTESEILVAATIHHADTADSEALKDAVMEAEAVLVSAEHENSYQEIVADKGYHKTETLAWLDERGVRTYIPQPRSRRKRKWSDKPASWQKAYRANRRRVAGPRSRALQRHRSERVERSFAHTCESGAARRTWLRGIEDIKKRYVIHAAARNLGTIMRSLFGVGTPRAMQRGLSGLLEACLEIRNLLRSRIDVWVARIVGFVRRIGESRPHDIRLSPRAQITPSSTAC
jgi:transposase